MASKCGLCSVLIDISDSGNVSIDKVYSLTIYCVDRRNENYFMAKWSIYVTVWAKTRHVHTQTEIHFIAPAYSYTK